MTTDEKYIVFKRDEFEAAPLPHGWRDRLPQPVDDGVVIRRQDVFAPPALDSYANAIRCAVELMKSDEALSSGTPQRLSRIADYFHEQAVAAWETDRKLPD